MGIRKLKMRSRLAVSRGVGEKRRATKEKSEEWKSVNNLGRGEEKRIREERGGMR